LVVGIGVIVLLGWSTGSLELKSIVPGLPTMQPLTATGLIGCGASLWLLRTARQGTGLEGRGRLGLALAAGTVSLIGLLSLVEHGTGVDLGLDQFPFPDSLFNLTPYPGHISVLTATNFLLLGPALLVWGLWGRHYYAPFIGAALISFIAFLGFFYGSASLGTPEWFRYMALHTATGFLIVAGGALAARGGPGGLTILASNTRGGAVARRLLPAAILVPPVLAWIRWQGGLAGLYGPEFGLALYASSNVAIMAALVVWTTLRLTSLDERRRRVEEERFRAVAIFETLLEQAPDGAIGVDTKGKITIVNRQTEKVFGYARDELLGKPIEILLPDRFQEGHVEQRKGYDRSPKARPMGTGLGVSGRRKDGSEFPVDVSLNSIETESGPFVLAFVRDVTDRKRAEEELANRAEELARSNAELEQFAYVASHDLQEPLRMVSSYTQLLARRYKGSLDKDADEFIAYAVEGAQRMQALIQDLLAFSRVGTKGKPFEEFGASEAVEAALANLHVAVKESQANVVVGDLPAVKADRGQFVQLFQNLIGNAIKFRGEGPPEVRVAAKRHGREWVFSVRDNGIGIDPAYLDRIFIVFQRLHTRKEYPGTGIGLAIGKKIVARHGGRIWVESEEGKGSTFFFSLPVESPRGGNTA
jgi:PAS domain S-box-containing protein